MNQLVRRKSHGGESELLEIGVMAMDQAAGPLSMERRSAAIHVMADYLAEAITYLQARAHFVALVGNPQPLERLREIVEVTDTPIPTPAGEESEDSPGTKSRKKMQPWSAYEDTRLLAGIYRYGPFNWAPICKFVGNGRTRAQCAQRWARGLNPRICKDTWGVSEDMRLMQLVQMFGDKAWTKIASLMGNRSDVQCRYHYHQLSRDMSQLMKIAEEPNKLSPFAQQQVQQIKPFFAAKSTPRFSVPVISAPSQGSEKEQHTAISLAEIGQRRASAFLTRSIPVAALAPLPSSERQKELEVSKQSCGMEAHPASIESLLNHY